MEKIGVDIRERILKLEEKHGGLRCAARVLQCDAAYLLRLRNGEKTNPSDRMLRKLGLRKVSIYVNIEHAGEDHGKPT